MCRTLIFEYEKSKESSVVNQSNLGAFYRFINKRMSCKSGVGPLKSASGSLLTGDRDKVTALNNYFEVYSRLMTVNAQLLTVVFLIMFLSTVDVTSNDVIKCRWNTSMLYKEVWNVSDYTTYCIVPSFTRTWNCPSMLEACLCYAYF